MCCSQVMKSLRAVEQSIPKIIDRVRSVFWLDAKATKPRPQEQIDQKSLAYGSTFFQVSQHC